MNRLVRFGYITSHKHTSLKHKHLTLCCITSCCIWLHCIKLHNITLIYITYITITYVCKGSHVEMQKYMYVNMYTRIHIHKDTKIPTSVDSSCLVPLALRNGHDSSFQQGRGGPGGVRRRLPVVSPGFGAGWAMLCMFAIFRLRSSRVCIPGWNVPNSVKPGFPRFGSHACGAAQAWR